MRTLRPRRELLLAATLAAASVVSLDASLGCGKAQTDAPVTAVPAPSAEPAGVSTPRTARALGLVKDEGTMPVDLQIAAAQQMLGQFPDVRDHWIALGRLWVRKARDAADPGFYLNAKACADVSLEIDPGNLPGENLGALGLNGDELFDVLRLEDGLTPGQRVLVQATGADASTRKFEMTARVDSPVEVQYLQHGGILPFVLRELLGEVPADS